MKRLVISLVTATTFYLAGYGVVRLCCGESGKEEWADSTGHHEKAIRGTFYLLPKDGPPRTLKQAVYFAFYPLGWAEHNLIGTGYGCIDPRSDKYIGLEALP